MFTISKSGGCSQPEQICSLSIRLINNRRLATATYRGHYSNLHLHTLRCLMLCRGWGESLRVTPQRGWVRSVPLVLTILEASSRLWMSSVPMFSRVMVSCWVSPLNSCRDTRLDSSSLDGGASTFTDLEQGRRGIIGCGSGWLPFILAFIDQSAAWLYTMTITKSLTITKSFFINVFSATLIYYYYIYIICFVLSSGLIHTNIQFN